MKRIEPRRMEPETDGEELIQLFDDVFGLTISPEMWQWKYRPPWTDRHHCWVGVCDGRVIGYVGAIPLRGLVDGKEVPFFQLADAMVHPKFRLRFDYFGLAAQAIRDDIVAHHPDHLLYGFSDHRAFRFFTRKGLGGLVEKACTRFVQPADETATSRFEIREWAWEESLIDQIWEQRNGFKVGLIRDGDYLRWRYATHPAYPYRLFGVYEDGNPVGWTVTGGKKKGKNNPRPEIPVVDMMIPESSTEDILAELGGHLNIPLKAWLPRHHAPGFPDRKETGTHVYHFVENSVVTTDYLRENLYYTMGDVDWW